MNIKQKIKKGECVYGTWCLIPSPEVINVIAQSGLDFVFIDMEHGSVNDYTNVGRMIMASQVEGCSAIVRVPKLQEDYMLKALDLFPNGIVVSHIETSSQAYHFVRYSKYHPKGDRGYSPFTRSGGYNFKQNYTVDENERLLNIAIVESFDGLDNLIEICSVPDIDVIYIGVYDISVSLGIPGQVKDKKVLDILEECCKIIKESGKAIGCMYHDKAEHDYLKSIGVTMFAYSVDTSILYEGYKDVKHLKTKEIEIKIDKLDILL